MSQIVKATCDCGAVEVTMNTPPMMAAFCHCEDCRELLNVPYHSLAVWSDPEAVQITKGQDDITEFQHPTKRMTRVYCNHCGESMYNTNSQGWRLASQLLIRKNNNSELPEGFEPTKHFFYDRRIVDIDDDLPQYG